MAATALTVFTFGVGAGAVVAMVATVDGTIGAVSNAQNEGNAFDGFSRGVLVGTVGAVGAVANPAGAFLGGSCQLATDMFRGATSSPEAYAGAMFGGAVGTEIGGAFVGGFAATGLGELLEKTMDVKSSYRYDCKGQIRELCHEDKEGLLDRYLYRYDLMGNKTGITKERRGLGYDGNDVRWFIKKNGDRWEIADCREMDFY